eukprot:Gb_31061 [translate_table: standard]
MTQPTTPSFMACACSYASSVAALLYYIACLCYGLQCITALFDSTSWNHLLLLRQSFHWLCASSMLSVLLTDVMYGTSTSVRLVCIRSFAIVLHTALSVFVCSNRSSASSVSYSCYSEISRLLGLRLSFSYGLF